MAPLVKVARRLPWVRVMLAAKWLWERGQDNLTKSEQSELGTLLKKSKGNPRNLNAREKTRLRNLVMKGLTGRKPA